MLKFLGELFMATRKDLDARLERIMATIDREKAEILDYATKVKLMILSYLDLIKKLQDGIPAELDYAEELIKADAILVSLESLSDAATIESEVVTEPNPSEASV